MAREPAPPPLVGRVLAGRYRLGAIIAEGGMASVYRATRVVSEEDVAVKVMHSHLTRDRGFAQRFKREALIAARLTHPGIVRVIDHDIDEGVYFIVMELLDGEDIFDVLKRHKRLDAAVARGVLVELCSALAEAHAQGIVHRDLKPENIFLSHTRDGRVTVKVLDFGVAKMLLPDKREANESDPVFTAMGTLLGTPEYLSPEMCRGEVVGPQADIYACGVLLFALLTGRPPFVTDNPLDVTIKHVSEAPVAPSHLVADIDPRLDAIVLQALAKQPGDRQASAAALADALLALGPVSPLPASLLGKLPQPRHDGAAPTLALEPSDRSTTVQDQTIAVEAPAPKPQPALAAPPPETRSPPVAATGTASAVWIAIAAVALAGTFLLGFAAGRWSATPAPRSTVTAP
jgi:serine/threonine-protein kinase